MMYVISWVYVDGLAYITIGFLMLMSALVDTK